VIVLDVNGNRWTRPTISGLPPAPRYGHSAILAGSNVIIFGGRGEKGVHFRDLHALDSLKMAWLNGPEGGAAPSGRLDHSATLVGNKMFVFGGWNGTDYYNDLYVLDLESMAWSRPSTSGAIPCPRMGHCAVLAGNTLIVQGGFYFDEAKHRAAGMRMGTMLSQCYQNDIRMLDTETFVWDRLNVSGVPPPPCFGHSMEVSGNDIIVFGGWGGFASKKQPPEALENSCEYFVILNTDQMTWERGQYIGLPPPPRYGHSATAIGPHILIFGGWESNQAVNDIIVLRDLSAVGRTGERAQQSESRE
jgi:host cell factor